MTNAKALLYFMYDDIRLSNIALNNVKCLGNGSLFLFGSEDNELNIEISEMNGNNCITNGSFIKVIGKRNNVVIEDSNLINISSYGPVIDNISKTVNYPKNRKII